jgi:hypothetical protein
VWTVKTALRIPSLVGEGPRRRLSRYVHLTNAPPLDPDGDDALAPAEHVLQLAADGERELGDAVNVQRFAAHFITW